MRDLCCVAPFREPGKLRFQESQTGTVLECLHVRIPFESALADQLPYALDRRLGNPAGGEQFADGLRLSPRRIAPPPQVSPAPRGKVRPRVSPPLEMLRADGYLEIFGGGLGEQA